MATEELLGDIFEKRDMLAKDLEQATDAALHQYLLDLAYDEATRRVTENYHPYVRYNAMLIIGNLNQTESRIAGGDYRRFACRKRSTSWWTNSRSRTKST